MDEIRVREMAVMAKWRLDGIVNKNECIGMYE